MTTILVTGLGVVGQSTVRHLSNSPEVTRILVADRDHGIAEAVASEHPSRVQAVKYGATAIRDANAVAIATKHDLDVIRDCLELKVAAVTANDDDQSVRAALDMDLDAQKANVTIALGAGFAPGLSDVLVEHAADGLDTIDEIAIARFGVAGPASASTVRTARRAKAYQWRDGGWRVGTNGPELVWFPDPIGAHECQPCSLGATLTAHRYIQVARVRASVAKPPGRWERFVQRAQLGDDQWGAIRVELWGTKADQRSTIVYGMIDRVGSAAGAMLALSARTLATKTHEPGVVAAAELLTPRQILADMSGRGIHAAVFEGA